MHGTPVAEAMVLLSWLLSPSKFISVLSQMICRNFQPECLPSETNKQLGSFTSWMELLALLLRLLKPKTYQP
jgi:hypothetical protein